MDHKELIEGEGGGWICAWCGHVHARPGDVCLKKTGLVCAKCENPVAFPERALDRGVTKHTAIERVALFLAALKTTTEVVAVAVPPACLAGSIEVVAGENGIALVNTKSGQEWHLSKLDALNLLASLARDVEIPPVVPFAVRVAL